MALEELRGRFGKDTKFPTSVVDAMEKVYKDYNITPKNSIWYNITNDNCEDNPFVLYGDIKVGSLRLLVNYYEPEKTTFVSSLVPTIEDDVLDYILTRKLAYNASETLHQNYALYRTYKEINAVPVFLDNMDNYSTFLYLMQDAFAWCVFDAVGGEKSLFSIKDKYQPTFSDFYKQMRVVVSNSISIMSEDCDEIDLRYGDYIFAVPTTKEDYKKLYDEIVSEGLFAIGDAFYLDVYENFKDKNLATHNGIAYLFHKDEKNNGEGSYYWAATCDDGSFEDESKTKFKTQRECYNDMRQNALEKMKWNTEYDDDFDTPTDEIVYSVMFSPNKITHNSYSGTYTYEIHKA